MGKAYSDDLRRKVLETREQGEGTLEDLAKRFGDVGDRWISTSGGGRASGPDTRRTEGAAVSGKEVGDQHRLALEQCEAIGVALQKNSPRVGTGQRKGPESEG